ncbi:MAG: hypothetical protein ACKOEO_21720, partial [Planctomycetaceae bacterium]
MTILEASPLWPFPTTDHPRIPSPHPCNNPAAPPRAATVREWYTHPNHPTRPSQGTWHLAAHGTWQRTSGVLSITTDVFTSTLLGRGRATGRCPLNTSAQRLLTDWKSVGRWGDQSSEIHGST